MRPKSKIYTPNRDDEHPRLFHMGVPPCGSHTKSLIFSTVACNATPVRHLCYINYITTFSRNVSLGRPWSVFWNWSGREYRMYYAMRKSQRFLHWSSGQDLLEVLKPTPLLPHAKMLLVPKRFFFWRVDYALEGSVF